MPGETLPEKTSTSRRGTLVLFQKQLVRDTVQAEHVMPVLHESVLHFNLVLAKAFVFVRDLANAHASREARHEDTSIVLRGPRRRQSLYKLRLLMPVHGIPKISTR